MSQTLNLVDAFHTFQGEGFHAGRRALFVRMPFCNLKCSWCDTEFNKFKTWDVDKFEAFAISEPNRFAVITGGEPMMNKHTPIVVNILKNLGFEIACETNGTFPIVKGIDFVTCSPKRDAKYEVHPDVWPLVDEFKYVVDAGFDLSILDRHDVNSPRRHSLSPEFNNMEASLKIIQQYIKENPKWKMSLQLHKWINIP